MRLALSILFIIFTRVVSAQQYGAQWVLGYRESVLDFRNDTLVNYAIQPFMPLNLTSGNICDSAGNLLYYTNGIYIAGADGNQIENGDSLSPCDWTNQSACCGMDIPQGSLFLPMPGNSRFYYLLHMSNDTLSGTRPGNLYYSIIDVDGNSGAGAVISKNIIFYKGIFRDGGITACKHANGRDWWIVMGDRHNTYYTFLLSVNGLSNPLIQTIGPSYYTPFDVAYSKFSQDGSKYVTSCDAGPILIMNFDRCSGEFSNPIVTSAVGNGAIIEFSPNGRFVYATNTYNLTQLDLSLANPDQDSITLYQADSSDQAQMGLLQLAPNGKLYATCFNGGFYFIHGVNYPDLKGDSAEYVDTAFTTQTANTINFPNMINYQLGPLVGSGCDTIKTNVGIAPIAKNIIRVLPNPADKYLYVEMGSQGNYQFELLNALGQTIATRETRQVDNFDTSQLPGGIYFLRVADNNQQIATQKVVIEH